MISLTVHEAVCRAQALAAAPGRRMLGLTGPPGAGKSTLASSIVAQTTGAVLVGMDGFHLAHSALQAMGAVDRKGAPQTFDAAGYVALLRRLRDRPGETVWAPEFRREIEDAVAGAVAVPASVSLVVTEGNYLLLDEAPWSDLADLLDEVWYLDVSQELRADRLTRRHEEFGRTAHEAWQRALGSDEENARMIRATRFRADAVVDVGVCGPPL